MSRESEILTILQDLQVKVNVLYDALPEETREELNAVLLESQYQDALAAVHYDAKPLQEFIKDHPKEALGFAEKHN